MMAAAAAWDGLAAELGSTATGYTSVITELTGSPWLGPASRSMVSAVTPYIAWISTAATLAEQSGNQARAAAAAFEAAFAQTVPPPVIAANRALLLTLIATNFFGQNTPAIAATEAQYAEMWAQDALAMDGYAATAAQAAVLPPFTPPPLTTAGPGAQVAGLAQSVGSTAARALATLSQLTAATPQTLLALIPGSSGSAAGFSPVVSFPAGIATGVAGFQAVVLPLAPVADAGPDVLAGASAATVLNGVKPFLDAGFGPVISPLATPPMVSAQLGQASMIGPLSVPPWVGPLRCCPTPPSARRRPGRRDRSARPCWATWPDKACAASPPTSRM